MDTRTLMEAHAAIYRMIADAIERLVPVAVEPMPAVTVPSPPAVPVLPPPPPPDVPTTTTTTICAPLSPSSVTNPNLDANGIPWDARIHSESRAKTVEGTWRRRRNIDQGFYDGVTAELRRSLQASEPSVPPPPPAPVAQVPPPPAPAAQVPPPPAPAAASGHEVKTWNQLMVRIVTTNVSPERQAEVCRKFEVSSIAEVYSQPELVVPIANELWPSA